MSAYSLAATNEAANLSDGWQMAVLKAASYLTDPICKVQESFYSLYIVDGSNQIAQIISLIVVGIFVSALLTPLTAPLGALLRAVVVLASPGYLVTTRGDASEFQGKQLKILSYNVCFMPGGYAITDGGVTPPSANDRERIRANVEFIKQCDADVVCLYEVPDACDAAFLSENLPDYPFIIPVVGPKAIGPSSMMYVASKYKIDKQSISFTPFLKGSELTGRGAHSEKGFLTFDLPRQNGPSISVTSTHLQHSEVPAIPETPEIPENALRRKEEEESRRLQMARIASKILDLQAQGKLIILTGDLNQEERELPPFLGQELGLHRDPNIAGQPTWCGEDWGAKLMGKDVSRPLVLDYTFVSKEAKIETKIIDVGFSAEEFRREALSDHRALLSTITLPATEA